MRQRIVGLVVGVMLVFAWSSLALANQQMLLWDASAPCTDPSCLMPVSYRIYKEVSCIDSNGYKPFPDISFSQTSFLDTDVWPGVIYCYYVVAVASTGQESVHSNVLRFQVPVAVVVPPPSNLRTP